MTQCCGNTTGPARRHVPCHAHRTRSRRRRLRADRARQLADLLRHQIPAGGFPAGSSPGGRHRGRLPDRPQRRAAAVNADAHSAAVLQAPHGAAVLMLERLTRLPDGRPVALEFIRFRGDRITMSGVLRRAL